MKHLLSISVIAILVTAFAVGCASRHAGGLPTVSQLSSAGVLPGDVDPARLARARATIFRECGACHRLYGAEELAERAWPGVTRNMGRRAGLPETDWQALGEYYRLSRRAADAAEGTRP